MIEDGAPGGVATGTARPPHSPPHNLIGACITLASRWRLGPFRILLTKEVIPTEAAVQAAPRHFAPSQRVARERNTMKRIALAALAGLLSLAFANPTINDEGFDYFEADGRSYYDLAVVDGELVVTLANESSSGAIAHVFEEIDREPKKELARIFTANVWVEDRDETEEDREAVTSQLRKMAGMGDLRSGWAVLHDEISLDAAIAAYTGWFTGAGLEMASDAGTLNVRPYNVTGDGLDSDLRVVFARKGDGVRVYIGPL